MQVLGNLRRALFKIQIQNIQKQQNKVLSTFCSENNENKQNNNTTETQKKGGVYIHKENYNREQYYSYTQKVNKALKERQDKEEFLKTADPIDLLPRRKRRVYDRPKHDLDITNYGAWRVFNGGVQKNHENGMPVVCKLPCTPKDVKHVFGEGIIGTKNNNRSTFEYDFQDIDNSFFLVYDWKATTQWWGDNIQGYDYDNQEHIYPRKRKIKYPSVEEFWESEEIHLFRVNCSRYADFRRFKKWFLQEIETKKNEKSLDEQVMEKYGEFQTFDDYNQQYDILKTPAVFQFDKTFWLEKGEKLDKKKVKESEYYQKITPAKQLDEQFRVNAEELEQQN